MVERRLEVDVVVGDLCGGGDDYGVWAEVAAV